MILTSLVTAAVVAKLSSAGIIKPPAFLKSLRAAQASSPEAPAQPD